MAKYSIPQSLKSDFELISKLPKTQIELFKSALLNTPVGSSPDETSKFLIGKIGLKETEIRKILKTVFGLIGLSIKEKVGKDELINDLVTSYQELEPSLKDEIKQKLNKNLQILLEADGNVKQSIKAFTLLRENEKIFIESRVISDIRIVFTEEIENPNQSAVIVHQLKIVYQEYGKSKETFFAMSKEDLFQLKETVVRALEKDMLIRKNTYKELSFLDLDKK